MTLAAFGSIFILLFASMVRVIGARPWHLAVRLAITFVAVTGLPALCWWLAFNSPGSGWMFGLVALMVSFTSLFGAVMGWIWLSLFRKA